MGWNTNKQCWMILWERELYIWHDSHSPFLGRLDVLSLFHLDLYVSSTEQRFHVGDNLAHLAVITSPFLIPLRLTFYFLLSCHISHQDSLKRKRYGLTWLMKTIQKKYWAVQKKHRNSRQVHRQTQADTWRNNKLATYYSESFGLSFCFSLHSKTRINWETVKKWRKNYVADFQETQQRQQKPQQCFFLLWDDYFLFSLYYWSQSLCGSPGMTHTVFTAGVKRAYVDVNGNDGFIENPVRCFLRGDTHFSFFPDHPSTFGNYVFSLFPLLCSHIQA